MKTLYHKILHFTFFALISCQDYKPFKTNNVKIIAMDSLEVENINGENRIPEKIRQLCNVFEIEEKESTQAFVLEPILKRIDLGQELSLKTDVKTFSGNKDNPKVLGKHIKKNFEEIIIVPELLSSKKKMGDSELQDALNEYLTNNLGQDSLIIFSEKESSLRIGDYSYKTSNDVEEIRKYMLSILKKNMKASFCVLWNPILSEVSKEKVVVAEKDKTKKEVKIISSKTARKMVKSDRIVIQSDQEEYKEVRIKPQKKEKWSGEGKLVNEVKNGTINGEEAKSKQ